LRGELLLSFANGRKKESSPTKISALQMTGRRSAGSGATLSRRKSKKDVEKKTEEKNQQT